MLILTALIAGTVFGAGLTVSQMVNPQKILGFFDFAAMGAGGWDPTMAFVFAGALAVLFLGYFVKGRTSKPVLDQRYRIPARTEIDGWLIGGTALFGLGWGLSGLCPGPAVAGLAVAGTSIGQLAVFLLALVGGVVLSLAVRRTIARKLVAASP